MNLLPQFASQHNNIDHLLNTIHHCDAMDLLARLPDASVDMVLCDLPYGVTACKWDTVIPIEPMWAELKRIVKPRAAIVLTATQPFTSRLVSSNYDMFRYEWIWEKDKGSGFLDAKQKPMRNHESILVFSEQQPQYNPQMREGEDYYRPPVVKFTENYSNFTGYGGKRSHGRYPLTVINFVSVQRTMHPTQKPVALFEYLIKTYTKENQIVLDMTCGSGTTAIAARKTNRRFICGDITQEYVDIANQRLQATDPYQATPLSNGKKQLSLFSA